MNAAPEVHAAGHSIARSRGADEVAGHHQVQLGANRNSLRVKAVGGRIVRILLQQLQILVPQSRGYLLPTKKFELCSIPALS
jgi:hypothetical protein